MYCQKANEIRIKNIGDNAVGASVVLYTPRFSETRLLDDEQKVWQHETTRFFPEMSKRDDSNQRYSPFRYSTDTGSVFFCSV